MVGMLDCWATEGWTADIFYSVLFYIGHMVDTVQTYT